MGGNKKILALLTLIVLAASVSAVSAFGFDDLLGGENETVTIDGIDFNIPAGFKEDANYSAENEKTSIGSVSYTFDQKLYEKGSTAVSILVADYGENKVTDEIVGSIGGEKATLNGIDGYSSKENDIYIFSYAKNDKLVTITSTDEKVISDFLIA